MNPYREMIYEALVKLSEKKFSNNSARKIASLIYPNAGKAKERLIFHSTIWLRINHYLTR
jgi:hypothetical protein